MNNTTKRDAWRQYYCAVLASYPEKWRGTAAELEQHLASVSDDALKVEEDRFGSYEAELAQLRVRIAELEQLAQDRGEEVRGSHDDVHQFARGFERLQDILWGAGHPDRPDSDDDASIADQWTSVLQKLTATLEEGTCEIVALEHRMAGLEADLRRVKLDAHEQATRAVIADLTTSEVRRQLDLAKDDLAAARIGAVPIAALDRLVDEWKLSLPEDLESCCADLTALTVLHSLPAEPTEPGKQAELDAQGNFVAGVWPGDAEV